MEPSSDYHATVSSAYSNEGAISADKGKFVDGESAALVAAIIAAPPRNVGPISSRLRDSNASMQDTATMPGAKSQRYTTWNCMSRSYIVFHTTYPNPTDKEDFWSSTVAELVNGNQRTSRYIAHTVEEVGLTIKDLTYEKPKIIPTAITRVCENRLMFLTFEPANSNNNRRHNIELLNARETGKQIINGMIGWSKEERSWFTPKMLLKVLREEAYEESDYVYSEDDYAPSTSSNIDSMDSCSIINSDSLCLDDFVGTDCDSNIPPNDQDPPWCKDCVPLYSDMLPVRVVLARKHRRTDELAMIPPYTPAQQSIESRLNDMSASSAMMSVVRSPTVRDGSTLFNLTKFTLSSGDSYKDITPMLRCLCIGLSLGSDAWDLDNTKYRFIRRSQDWTDAVITIPNVLGAPQMPQCNIIAMPVDIAISLAMNKMQNVPPEIFRYHHLDKDFVFITIRTPMLFDQYATAYVACHLTSELWNGRVNWTTTGRYNMNDGTEGRRVGATFMPEINSTYIPGVTNAVLVLLDYSSTGHPPFVQLNQLQVPIWDGTNANIQPVNFTRHWTDQYWNNDSLDRLRSSMTGVWDELCRYNAVGDTCGIALSIAAELYNHNFAGMSMPVGAGGGAYNFNLVDGAWGVGGGFVEGAGGKYACQNCAFPQTTGPEDNNATQLWRERLVGFNFSALSPLHRVPTGVVRLVRQYHQAQNAKGENYVDSGFAVWSENRPKAFHYGYEVSDASSFMRLAIGMGLIHTHHQHYEFENFVGMETWMNMLSSALAMSTANALGINNINLKVWTGWADFMSYTNEFNTLHKLLNEMTLGICQPIQINELITMDADWGWANAAAYYNRLGVLQSNPDWWSHSPWPFHSICQWANKMKYKSYSSSPQIKTLTFILPNQRLVPLLGVDMRDDMKFWKFVLVGTIDITRYAPRIYIKEVGYNDRYARIWFDQWAYISNADFEGVPKEQEYMESNSWLIPKTTYPSFSACSNIIFVIDTRLQQHITEDEMLKVWPLRYPDPPTVSDFLRIARDYIVIPAASGLATYLATGGNPVAAGAAAVGSAISSATKDLHKKELRDVVRETQNRAPTQVVQAEDLAPPKETVDETKRVAPAQGTPGTE